MSAGRAGPQHVFLWMPPGAFYLFLACDTGGTQPQHEHSQALDRLVDDLQGVEERSHHDHRGAVLVVVEDGDVELLLEPVLDLETTGGGDVLEIDPAEGGRDQLDRLD